MVWTWEQVVVQLLKVQLWRHKVADGTWMEEVAVGWLAKPRMKQVVDEQASFVEDAGCASELEWQVAD